MKNFLLRFILLLLRNVIVELAVLPKVCPDEFISTENHNGLCCRPVECQPDHYINPCQKNYESDECLPCPEGSYMEDMPTSAFIVQCIPYDCPQDTVPQKYRSTEHCSKHCRCDIKKGYCGHDACNCRYLKCGFRENLTQNCGCDPWSMKANTKQNDVASTPWKEQIKTNASATEVSAIKSSTMEPIQKEANTVTTKEETPPPPNDGETGFKWWIAVLVGLVTIFIVLIVLGICIKRRTVIYNYVMNVYGKYANVAAGDNATTIVQQDKSSTYSDDSDSSQDSAEFKGF